ncbi:phosphatase PAP2 family protein [Candidatus Parcubacteria bacterium]|nr:MAG: phosphatase PAP2 family protein [Candidatus Parcubacteria bacterium]
MEHASEKIFGWVFALSGENAALDFAGVFLARYLLYVLIALFLFAALKELGWRKRLFLFIEGALAAILARGVFATAVHYFFPYPRPEETFGISPLIESSGSAFPSGHASFLFAVATVLLYHDRRLGSWLAVGAVLNGLARTFVGLHWPLDVFGGALVGIAGGVIAHLMLRPISQKL